MRLSLLAMMVLATCSCTTTKDSVDSTVPCSDQWFLLVEQKISVTDNQGHGPDLGSMEWRSAVEFKLVIRGNAENPPIDSKQWCDYIDARYAGANSAVINSRRKAIGAY